MFNKILAAIDGSPASEKVLATAVDLATHYQTELVGLSVVEMPEVVAMADEVDELRRGADDYYREIGEGAVGYARSRGRETAARGHPRPCRPRNRPRRRGRKRGPDRAGPAGTLAHHAVLPRQHHGSRQRTLPLHGDDREIDHGSLGINFRQSQLAGGRPAMGRSQDVYQGQAGGRPRDQIAVELLSPARQRAGGRPVPRVDGQAGGGPLHAGGGRPVQGAGRVR